MKEKELINQRTMVNKMKNDLQKEKKLNEVENKLN